MWETRGKRCARKEDAVTKCKKDENEIKNPYAVFDLLMTADLTVNIYQYQVKEDVEDII